MTQMISFSNLWPNKLIPGAWNSSNAYDLMKEFASQYDNAVFAYELGNEVT